MSKISEFVETYLPYAKRVSEETGGVFRPEYFLGQWALERGWNHPTDAGGRNNLAGIKPGSRDNPGGGEFMNYDSIDDFVSDYIVQFNRIVANREGDTFLEKLANGAWVGYDADANADYAQRVSRTVDMVFEEVAGLIGATLRPDYGVTKEPLKGNPVTTREFLDPDDYPAYLKWIPSLGNGFLNGIVNLWNGSKKVLLFIGIPAIIGVVVFVVYLRVRPKKVILQKEGESE